MKQYRQGDVFFEMVKEIPKSAKKLKHKIVAEGEATGHHHQFKEDHVTLLEHEEELYVNVASGVPDLTDKEFEDLIQDSVKQGKPKGAALVHEEHGTIVLPPGKYKVTHQREYSPERIRRVVD